MKALVLSICILIVSFPTFARDEVRPAFQTPSPTLDLIHARPFTLAKGYRYDWRKERPIVRSGILVVLKVKPELVVPSNAALPVLYAGNQTVQRLNHGHQSGHVIAIIPGALDLTLAPIWFGKPDLPERASAQTIRAERALAEEAKILPFSAKTVARVSQTHVAVSDLTVLLRDYAADLVLKYSPQEKALAETWRLPVARAVPKPNSSR